MGQVWPTPQQLGIKPPHTTMAKEQYELIEGSLLHTLNELQKAQAAWQKNNEPRFGVAQPRQMLWGVGEEFGEFQHSVLKRAQGIRGTWEEHSIAMEDAIADMMIYLCGYANTADVNMAFQCLAEEYGIEGTDLNYLEHHAESQDNEEAMRLQDEAVFRVQRALGNVWEDRCLHNQTAKAGFSGNDPSTHYRTWSLIRAINCLSLIFTGKDCVTHAVVVFERIVSKRNWVANASDGNVQADGAVIVQDNNDEGKTLLAWEEASVPAGADVYSKAGCIFNYCPNPETCQASPGGCVNPSRKQA